jgi:hypothetical protein
MEYKSLKAFGIRRTAKYLQLITESGVVKFGRAGAEIGMRLDRSRGGYRVSVNRVVGHTGVGLA